MKSKRFAQLIALVLCGVMAFVGEASAGLYDFETDSSVSPGRNKTAEYAYEILNYWWTADQSILLHNEGGATEGPGNIRGIPYTLYPSGQMTFSSYKTLIENNKKGVNNGLYNRSTYSIGTDNSGNTIYRTSMTYGMACAMFVTDCIRQGFLLSNGNVNTDTQTLFHKRGNWGSSVVDSFSDSVWQTSHSRYGWRSIASDASDSDYRKLKRGDYCDNYDHVILVINNYDDGILYIDQTAYFDNNNHVGTHIGTKSYSSLRADSYVPMYVTYPDDDLVIPDSWIKIDEAHFPDYYFRKYVSQFDFDGNGYFSDAEIESISSFGDVGGPHPQNGEANNGNYGEEWKNIKSIEGVKIFKNLEWLYVFNNGSIENIDVSGMTKLGDLRCYGNKITNINAYGCTSLWNLEAQNNELTSITLADCPKLQKLNISNNAKLVNLYCADCSLTSLIASNCTSLSHIDCSGNSNVQLALTGCSSLETLIRDSSVNVRGSAPVFTTSNLPDAKVNTYYSQYVTATGQTASGTPSVFYRISSRRKTLNFSINKTTGFLSGTPTEAVNNAELTIVAYNYVGSTSKSLPVNVLPIITPPSITTSNTTTIEAITKQASFRQGNNTFTGFTATGENITWKISSGSLPAGLGLNSSTGKLTGTPNYTENGKTSWKGVTYNFSVTATNNGGSDTKSFTMNLFESPIITTTAGTLKDGYVGDKYTAEINATGSNYYMGWGLDSGSFPDGVGFDKDNMSSGSHGSRTAIITGTPTRAESYPFTLKVAAGSLWAVGLSPRTGEYATKDFTIQIADKPVINGSFTDGTVGVEYSGTVEVKGGFSSYSWAYGSLPTGLKVLRNGSKFTLYSTPTKEGSYPFTLTVTDKNGKTNTKTFNINIAPAGVAVNSTNFPDANFRSYVSNLDKDSNGYLSASEIANVRQISLYSKETSTLKGIEYFTELTELSCNSQVVDVSKNAKLQDLTCKADSLRELNIGSNKSLTYLKLSCTSNTSNSQLSGTYIASIVKSSPNLSMLYCCGLNNLSVLDVSQNTKLTNLYCWRDENLATLILGNNSVLLEVDCRNNPSLKKLDVRGCPKLIKNQSAVYHDASLMIIYSTEQLGLEVNATNFPDTMFRKYVSDNFDKDGDGYLSNEEIANAKTVYVYNKGISSLKGIEYLTELTSLSCNFNKITTLNLSKNTKLQYLYCRSNNLRELTLGNNSALVELDCRENSSLTTLDTRGCPKLNNFQYDTALFVEDGSKPEFRTHSLMLEGQIGVNFYMKLPGISIVNYADSNACYMNFNIRGIPSSKSQYFDANFRNKSKTYYGFRCYINSIQMADNILAQFHYGNQTVNHDYSVKTYLDVATSKASSKEEKELMEAIRDYGHYAQVFLSRYHGWTRGVEHVAIDCANQYSQSDIEKTKEAVSSYNIERNVGNSGIEKVSYSLSLESETVINVYLKLSPGYVGNVTAYIDGGSKNEAVLQPDGRYKIEIKDIAAHLLGKTYVIKVNARGTFNIKVSALSYVNTVLSSSASLPDEKNAVVSIYNYYVKTLAYRKSQGYN